MDKPNDEVSHFSGSRRQMTPHLKFSAQMFSDGKKDFLINLSKLKIFLHPYFFLMIDIFFREGMPVYDDTSTDKPNQYTSDPEDCSKLFCKVLMDQVLVCLSSGFSRDQEDAEDQLLRSQHKKSQTIVCLASIDYEFERENIKAVKA